MAASISGSDFYFPRPSIQDTVTTTKHSDYHITVQRTTHKPYLSYPLFYLNKSSPSAAMQGDIFMLDQSTMQMPAENKTNNNRTTPKKVQAAAAQVAIYNEDDLSHLLFADSEPAHHHHHHHQHHLDGSLTPLTAPASSGTHTPAFSDQHEDALSDGESAVLEDWEEAGDAGIEIPPSPSPRRRGGTMCSTDDDFEWPVFLGRQADELAPSLRRRSSAASSTGSASGKADAAPPSRVPRHHHVESISGPLMALWPASVADDMEWSERFYE